VSLDSSNNNKNVLVQYFKKISLLVFTFYFNLIKVIYFHNLKLEIVKMNLVNIKQNF